jgi:hypothetical protein
MSKPDKAKGIEQAVVDRSGPDERAISGHSGPWAIVSREGSAAPHAQCAGCGFIDRTGDVARELAQSGGDD